MNTNCPKCKKPMSCLGGCSAHENNWYCNSCEYEAWNKEAVMNTKITDDVTQLVKDSGGLIAKCKDLGYAMELGEQEVYVFRPDEFRKVLAIQRQRQQVGEAVPKEAIESILAEVMEIAVSNGANSISMPDQYVEVAAWLAGIATPPSPTRELLEKLADEIEADASVSEEDYEAYIDSGNSGDIAEAASSSSYRYIAKKIRALIHQEPKEEGKS